jgi:hypothetical protein
MLRTDSRFPQAVRQVSRHLRYHLAVSAILAISENLQYTSMQVRQTDQDPLQHLLSAASLNFVRGGVAEGRTQGHHQALAFRPVELSTGCRLMDSPAVSILVVFNPSAQRNWDHASST